MIKKLLKQPAHKDGVLQIYAVKNEAQPGKMPIDKLTLKHSLRLQERIVGINRFYAALQAQVNVGNVFRVPQVRDVSTQDIAVPLTRSGQGGQYRIVQIQYPEDVTPPVMDITLERLDTAYEFA